MALNISKADQVDWKILLDKIAHDLREARAHLDAGYVKDMWMELMSIHQDITITKNFLRRK